MPPKRKSPRDSQSQASTSSQNYSQLSQSRLDQHFVASQVSVEDQINNVIRYFINNAGQNVYFRRADIQKHCVFKAGQHFQQVMDRATQILKNVYGYNVLVVDAGPSSGKAYVVSNAMPHKNYSPDKNKVDDDEVKKIVLLLILSHIFMTNSPVNDASLYSFLKSFDIDVDVRHRLFGHVKPYIINTLVKQKFLATETDPISKKMTFTWGARAEKEISKMEILKFVCQMFKDRQPKAWTTQYNIAAEQGFENERLQAENRVHMEEEI